MKLSEFFKVYPANDAIASISSQHLLEEVKKALRYLACFGFVKAMTERVKLGEQEYQPCSDGRGVIALLSPSAKSKLI